MQEDLDIKISMLLDDELDSEEALNVLSRIQNEPELRAKWLRYSAVRCALKGEAVVLSGNELFERISTAVVREAEVVKPVAFSRKMVHQKLSATLALAASVAVVAVIIWSGIPASINSVIQQSNQVALAVTPIQAPAAATAVVPVESGPDETQTLPKRWNDYLITHNESAYTSGTQAVMPYARVISYSHDR